MKHKWMGAPQPAINLYIAIIVPVIDEPVVFV